MDDPTRRCENDTGIETRLPGLPIPSGSPIFLWYSDQTRPVFRDFGI
jgi:hypothetical protein